MRNLCCQFREETQIRETDQEYAPSLLVMPLISQLTYQLGLKHSRSYRTVLDFIFILYTLSVVDTVMCCPDCFFRMMTFTPLATGSTGCKGLTAVSPSENCPRPAGASSPKMIYILPRDNLQPMTDLSWGFKDFIASLKGNSGELSLPQSTQWNWPRALLQMHCSSTSLSHQFCYPHFITDAVPENTPQ